MPTIDQINQALPQTQCKLCEFDGCKPYAEAICNGTAPIDRCAPGGLTTLKALAKLTHQDDTPFVETVSQRFRQPSYASIDEDLCIGCTKCIQACPTDAIIGANKLMHSILSDECSGCELCIEPCPMDCIEMVEIDVDAVNHHQKYRTQWKQRFEARTLRLEKYAAEEKKQHKTASLQQDSQVATQEARKKAIAEIMARMQKKQ